MTIEDRFPSLWRPKRGYTERQALITAERDKGRTYDSIAEEFGLSRERIRQIVAKVTRRRKSEGAST